MTFCIKGDGTINFDEFRQLLDKYKLSKSQSSQNGVHEKLSSGEHSFSEINLRETFRVFDKDEDGYLNAADLR